VGIEGVDPAKLTAYLWARFRIIVVGITHEQFKGIRVTPNVYTTLDEIDTFGEIMEGVAKNGLPAGT
jgi:isopenicillin-N epimerase